MSDLILHHYWPSPFAHKIRLALALGGLSWLSVEIPRVPPKPLLMPLTAGYRRTPVLQVGSDIYCDTQNIARYLGESNASEALFPNDSIDKILIFTAWLDQVVFPLCVRTVLTLAMDTSPPEFIKDRAGLYFGPKWSAETLKEQLSGVLHQLTSEFQTINRALGGTGGLFGPSLSYADVSIVYLAWFLRGRWDEGMEFLSHLPNITRIERIFHEKGDGQYRDLAAEDALAIAKHSHSTCPSINSLRSLGTLELGQRVSIKPQAETSDEPIIGTLHALSETRVSISHQALEIGEVVVHLPIAGYQIQAID